MDKQGPGGLLATIIAESSKGLGNGCTVSVALAKLAPDVAAQFVEAMALPKETARHNVIARHLAELSGVKILDQTVGRHRQGKCSCPH